VGSVRLEVKFWSIAVVLMSFLLLAALMGYFFAENFLHRP